MKTKTRLYLIQLQAIKDAIQTFRGNTSWSLEARLEGLQDMESEISMLIEAVQQDIRNRDA